YCTMHRSVPICKESGLLATDYCPEDAVESRGIVLIPRGHPLYDYIDSYGDVIRKYLGDFASLKSNADIASHTCSVHNAYTSSRSENDLANLVQEAYSLTLDAYRLVSASPELSVDQRRQINSAISAVQTLLSLSPIDYESLSAATSHLRNQLDAIGLY
ncbi:MAG: hypothetical protein J6A79_14450, partial [Clostridia bacterium]|nr:hypothetical protein [Clostridia bacterium]